MNTPTYNYEGDEPARTTTPDTHEARQFKKLKRPIHAVKRSKSPERLRGMHRRRRKRMGW